MKERIAWILSIIIVFLLLFLSVHYDIEVIAEVIAEEHPIVVLTVLGLVVFAMIVAQIKNRIKEYKVNPKETIKSIKRNLIGALIIILGFILFFVVPCFYVINNN